MIRRLLSLVSFLVLVIAGGFAISFLNTPDNWYAGLAKPSWNPPAWVFAPVWTVVYLLIAIAGWRTFERDATQVPWLLWLVQLLLNFLWSPTFFSAHYIGLALLILFLLIAVVCAFIVVSWHRDRIAAYLMVPYAVWLAFASTLNAAIFVLN